MIGETQGKEKERVRERESVEEKEPDRRNKVSTL